MRWRVWEWKLLNRTVRAQNGMLAVPEPDRSGWSTLIPTFAEMKLPALYVRVGPDMFGPYAARGGLLGWELYVGWGLRKREFRFEDQGHPFHRRSCRVAWTWLPVPHERIWVGNLPCARWTGRDVEVPSWRWPFSARFERAT